ncbi:hypothetical protein QQS45_11970 [Alteriqipengyuania flavescens]|uniref:hypothetical protein n=1 Tax=Alteriqipengyuania flavescens TaxID=3053610 RepID=UPI0025B428F3|nr:hypothetical protein [Alteriqipengyuania flavescens]WJY18326.1 hypothetical protein QQW98_11965 [Alteriqipengyuania flavescens]WJY24267.1 hypothetical protein QQS45_11970 [Alteriqipengyuania flavescens]
MSEFDRRRYRALSGYEAWAGKMRNSHIPARCKLAKYVAKEIRKLAADSDPEFFHITLLADEGIMPIEAPDLPLQRLRLKAFRAMQAVQLYGFYVVEVQAVTNWSPQGNGVTLHAHVHMIGWNPAGTKPLTTAAMKKALSGNGTRVNAAWTSTLGAKPVVIKRLGARFGCPSYAAAYALKLPHDAKLRWPRKGSDKFRFRSTVKGYRPGIALRIHELYAETLFGSNVGGVGEGAGIISDCKERAKKWAARKQASLLADRDPVEPFDERAFWARTRRRRSPDWKPAVVRGPPVRK